MTKLKYVQRKQLIQNAAMLTIFLIVYLLWFFALEKYSVPRFIIYTPLDDLIPFCEFFIIAYYMWFVYIALALAYLLFFDNIGFRRAGLFLGGGMVVCMILYMLFPNAQALRPDVLPRENIFAMMVLRLYATDTPTNVCPSIHVFNSIGVHIAVLRAFRNRTIRTISLVLMILISLSTVFLKQHSVIDGFCSILLAIPFYFAIYYRSRRVRASNQI